ncbi:MAG: hypothetical protein VYB61_03245 [Verrucomicrobiota bacterium]|nr:hypothetical protein [Verrucomicrobiota bacterium]
MNYLLIILALALCTGSSAQEFQVPEVSTLPRIDRDSPRPSRAILRNSAFILKMQTHPPLGEAYVILTDHKKEEYLKPLRKLAKHRNATIVKTTSLAAIHQPDVLEKLKGKLKKLTPRYVALAPRMESFRENMLLGAWELLSTLDKDPYLDAYPGILPATSPANFNALIDRTINYRSIGQKDLKPFAISQVPSNTESRSLQKAGILRKVFADYGIQTPTLAIYTPRATDAPQLKGNQVWNIRVAEKGKFVRKFDVQPGKALNNAQLVIMHGHGIPGMSCSVDIEGIPSQSSNQVILSGSCFSAVPINSDLPRMTSAPGGYKVDRRPAFGTRYLDRGGTVFFGHMRLSSGFPHLYPVLENWLQGASVGEAYQQLINAIIEMRGFRPGNFIVKTPVQQRRIPQNTLLYAIFGDPALKPLQPLKKIGAEEAVTHPDQKNQ